MSMPPWTIFVPSLVKNSRRVGSSALLHRNMPSGLSFALILFYVGLRVVENFIAFCQNSVSSLNLLRQNRRIIRQNQSTKRVLAKTNHNLSALNEFFMTKRVLRLILNKKVASMLQHF